MYQVTYPNQSRGYHVPEPIAKKPPKTIRRFEDIVFNLQRVFFPEIEAIVSLHWRPVGTLMAESLNRLEIM
jgi:hypothetical protein